MIKHRVVLTEDGSQTIINENINEHYHSIHGAVQESRHIFINSGYSYKTKSQQSLNILEIGLGTGLNALLTIIESSNIESGFINYYGIEPYPIDASIVKQLDYCNFLNAPELKNIFNELHNLPEKKELKISKNFNFVKILSPFEDYATNVMFDLIYFDAFSPANDAKLWTEEIFLKLHSMMNKGGVLVTYCSKGSVRRILESSNYSTERLPGPPGKHEILRATAL